MIRKSVPLLLLLMNACTGNIQAAQQQDYNIMNYGAVNDTATLSTAAFNTAIQQCHANGGGRVYVPAGHFKSGTIVLLSNVELYLERGAVVYASTKHEDFPRQKQPAYRSQKDPGGWYALIYAEGAVNIGIGGKGTIDGQGASQLPRPELLGGDRDGRPRNILLISCKKVTVNGITMLNSGIWNQHYLDCEEVAVSDINVYNHSNRNNDGIDIDGCRRFMLSNSIIDSDDDGVVIKSTGAAPCEDITITNCIVSSFCNAIKCGTESTGGFRNITVSNCVVKPSRNKSVPHYGQPMGVSAISLMIVDGGILDGVNVNNIVVEGTQCPIYIRLGDRARKHIEEGPVPGKGIVRNIMITDINAYNTGNYSSSITAVKGTMIENVFLANIQVQNKGGLKSGDYIKSYTEVKEDEKGYPQPTAWQNLPGYGFFIRHARNVVLNNVSLSSVGAEPRIPVVAVDVDGLSIHNCNTPAGQKKAKYQVNDVRNFTVDEKDERLIIQ